jgi:hypothetical protein
MVATSAGEQFQIQRTANTTTPCMKGKDSEAQLKIVIAAFANLVKGADGSMLNDEQLRTLLTIAEKASTRQKWTLYVDGSICANVNGGRHSIAKITFPKLPESVLDGRHIAAFDPSTCAELVREVMRLREQWNTRFNTLCGNCGKRYLGPRDEHLHGIGICGDKR